MDIALIHTPLVTPTGGERQVLKLAIELQKRGHSVDLFTNEARAEQCFPDLMAQVNVRVIPCARRHYRHFFGMADIGRTVARGRYDLINNHNFPSEWAVWFAKTARRTPAVWMCNEPPLWMYMPEERQRMRLHDWPVHVLFDRLSVRSIDRIVVLSGLTGKIVKDTYGRDSEVIRSGVDVEQFAGASPGDFRQRYGIGDAFMMLQVGALTHFKRPDDAVNALRLVSDRHPDARLVFIGPEVPETKQRLEVLIRQHGLIDRVLFLGPRPDPELRQAYAACDVFLFPSFQSWSLVATEAMASGKPVIVSRRCGVAEIIASGVNGFVADHGDYGQIAGYAEALADDRQLRGTVGKNALATVRDNLTWQKYAENMEAVFKRATGSRK